MGPIGIDPLTGQPLGGAEEEEQQASPSLLEQLMARANPLAEAAQTAALRLPKDRENEIYKRKIQQMFGVKLGEKNPKWRSALRFIGEGLGDLAAGYNHMPTLRERSRREAAEEYKIENEVLGKESNNLLARLVAASGQDKRAAAEANKLAAKKEYEASMAALKARALDSREKLDLSRIEQMASAGKHQEALAELRKVQAANEGKRGEFIGKTPEMITAEAARQNPDLLQDIFNITGARQAGKVAAGGGGGTTRTTTSTRSQIVPNPATGNLERVEMPSTSTSSSGGSNPDAAYRFMEQVAKREGNTIPEAPRTPTSPAVNGETTPNIQQSQPAFPQFKRPKNPGIAYKETENASRQIEGLRSQQLNIRTPAWGKKYEVLKSQATGASNVIDAVLGAATDLDSSGTSALSRYAGGQGAIRNVLSRMQGTTPSSITNANEVIQTVADKYRQDITGAGAGYQEIKYLASRFPEIGKRAGLEHKYTALQKALTLHFVAQKSLWNFEHDGAPELNGEFFPANKVSERIDNIVNTYKEMEKQAAFAKTPKQRKAVVESFQNFLKDQMNARTLYDEEWKNVNPPAPQGRTIRIP